MHNHVPVAIVTALTLSLVLAANAAMASPDRARSGAADFIQSVAAGECEPATSRIDWPLKLNDESIEPEGWQSTCERLRARLITARIDNVFQSDELTSTMLPRGLDRDSVYFVDLVRPQRTGDKRSSGMNLAFECADAGCRLIAIHERLLHQRHYARYEQTPDYEHAVQVELLGNVVSDMAPIRLMLAEHYLSYGEWPTSLEALGLEPQRLHTRGIEKIELLSDGGIRAHLSADFGPGRTLDLVPAEEMGGLSMRWDCRTNLPGELTASFIGLNCRSRK